MGSQFCFGNDNLIGVTLTEKASISEGTMVDVGLSKVFLTSFQIVFSNTLFYEMFAWD